MSLVTWNKQVKLIISDIPKKEIKDKYFLVRVNFDDTHFDLNKKIDDIRMHMAKPTLEYLSDNGGKIILFNHIGRPQGKFRKYLQTNQVTKAFSKLLNKTIKNIDGEIQSNGVFKLIGNNAKKIILDMKDGDIVMLENTRFDRRENSVIYEDRLSLAQDILDLVPAKKAVFIIDGFPVTHRDNTATLTEIAKLAPGVKGFWQIKEEVLHNDFLKVLKTRSKHDKLTVIFGGNKVDKQHEVSKFAERFLKAGDFIVLAGKYPERLLDSKTIQLLNKRRVNISRPLDSVGNGKDIGSKTIEYIKKVLDQTDILFWEGPLGKFEQSPYHEGGFAIVRHIANLKKQSNKLKRVFISGGELGWMTKLALDWTNEHLGSIEGFTISTGGGTSIAFFGNEGKLPGTKHLKGWDVNYI